MRFYRSGSFYAVMTDVVQSEGRMTFGATFTSTFKFKFTSDNLFERSSELSAVEAVQNWIGCRISKYDQLREFPQFVSLVDVKVAQCANDDKRRPTAKKDQGYYG